MDGGWVLVAVGALGSMALLLKHATSLVEHALDAIPGLAQRMVRAIHALQTVSSAWKGTKVDDDKSEKGKSL